MKDETLIKAVNLWFWKHKRRKINLIYHQHYFKNENGKRVLCTKYEALHYKFWFDEDDVLRSKAYV